MRPTPRGITELLSNASVASAKTSVIHSCTLSPTGLYDNTVFHRLWLHRSGSLVLECPYSRCCCKAEVCVQQMVVRTYPLTFVQATGANRKRPIPPADPSRARLGPTKSPQRKPRLLGRTTVLQTATRLPISAKYNPPPVHRLRRSLSKHLPTQLGTPDNLLR